MAKSCKLHIKDYDEALLAKALANNLKEGGGGGGGKVAMQLHAKHNNTVSPNALVKPHVFVAIRKAGFRI